MLSLNSQLLDWAIGHSVYLARLQVGEARRVSRFLETDVWPSVFDRVTRIPLKTRGMQSSVFKTKTLKTAFADIRGLFKEGYQKGYTDLTKRLVELGKVESLAWKKAITSRMPLSVAFDLPSAGTIRQLVTSSPFENALLKEWFGDLSRRAAKGVERAITAGMVRGSSVDEMVSVVRKSVTKQTAAQTEAVVRTAVNHVSTQTREATFAANEDLIDEVQWVSTLDARTTLICMSLDGKRFPVNEGRRPPAHFNCRSTTVPVVKSWQELGIPGLKELPASTRASMNGQVADKTTYEEWLRKRSDKQQNEILGPKRAELFRNNSLSLKEMVNGSTGRPFTLEQLRTRYGIESNS